MLRNTSVRLLPALGLMVCLGLAQEPGPDPRQDPCGLNVNCRYTIESIEFKSKQGKKLKPETQKLLESEAGQRLLQDRLDGVLREVKRELKGYSITQKVVKGSKPDQVKVVIEAERKGFEILTKTEDFKILYNTRNNFTFGGLLEFDLDAHNTVLAGLWTDNDSTVERFSGLRGGLEHKQFGNRLRLRVLAESYRAQWNGATLDASPDLEGIYRERHAIEPLVAIQLLKSLEWRGGLRFTRLQMQYPDTRFESAHALVSALRFAKEMQGVAGMMPMSRVDAGYGLTAGLAGLGSDFAYTRQTADARYQMTWGGGRRQDLIADVRIGRITGTAPLLERFVLGNSQTLRGWNRFDLGPRGGYQMAHATCEYRFRGWRVLYDTGGLWVEGKTTSARHSVGAGYISKEGVSAVIAFPLRDNQITPILTLGYTF